MLKTGQLSHMEDRLTVKENIKGVMCTMVVNKRVIAKVIEVRPDVLSK